MISSYGAVNKCETNKIKQTKKIPLYCGKRFSVLLWFSGGTGFFPSRKRWDLDFWQMPLIFLVALKKQKCMTGGIPKPFVKRSSSCVTSPEAWRSSNGGGAFPAAVSSLLGDAVTWALSHQTGLPDLSAELTGWSLTYKDSSVWWEMEKLLRKENESALAVSRPPNVFWAPRWIHLPPATVRAAKLTRCGLWNASSLALHHPPVYLRAGLTWTPLLAWVEFPGWLSWLCGTHTGFSPWGVPSSC